MLTIASLPSPTISIPLLLLTFYLASLLLRRSSSSSSSSKNLPLPPGPKGLPLLGNINDLPPPDAKEYLHWLKHKDLYGPISSVTVFGQTMILLHDRKAAVELMEKRASVHSGRPKMTFGFDM